jgi:hypothetical protein
MIWGLVNLDDNGRKEGTEKKRGNKKLPASRHQELLLINQSNAVIGLRNHHGLAPEGLFLAVRVNGVDLHEVNAGRGVRRVPAVVADFQG